MLFFKYNNILIVNLVMSSKIFEQSDDQLVPLPETMSYSDDLNSSEYINQFLAFYDDRQLNALSQKNTLALQNQQFDENYKLTDKYQEFGDLIWEKQNKKSSFHNFQKHLVLTLRQWVKVEQIPVNNTTNNLQKRLWQLFVKNSQKTRSLLCLVTGGIQFQQNKSKRLQKKYGIAKIIKNQPLANIVEAQKNLQDEIRRQCGNNNFEYYLKNRRMKDKENFRIYFDTFLEELKSGHLKKRTSKTRRMIVKKIQHNIKDFQGLSYNKA